MKAIEKINDKDFPFSWANVKAYRASDAHRKEIYLTENGDLIEGLMFLFYALFGKYKDEIFVYSDHWWEFSLDTATFETDPAVDMKPVSYDYSPEGKSEETKAYLALLRDADIEIGYEGSCRCLNWDTFLPTVLRCVVNHTAPYSPVFYNKENQFFFYFHHSGSIGMYYREHNDMIDSILDAAMKEYEVCD